MPADHPSLAEAQTRLQSIADRIHAQCEVIARELDRSRKMDRARVAAAQNAITREINNVHQFVAVFNAAYHAAGEEMDTTGGVRRIIPTDWLATSAHVGHMRNWANGWRDILQLVAEQCPPRRRPLDLPPERSWPVLAASTGAADRVVNRLHKVLNPHEQTEAAAAHGCFQDIALPHSRFSALALSAWRILKAQKHAAPTRFIDVGCGGGLKVLSALEFFDEATGLEFDPAYVDAARDLLDKAAAEDARIVHGDALEFDDYGAFDVIYLYRPIRDTEKLWALEERIAASAAPGTLLIAPYEMFAPRSEKLGCAPVCNFIYLAGSNARQAASLRREAEFAGANIDPAKRPLRSIWDPILAASRRRGF